MSATGCPYRNRCPYAMPRCEAEMPPAYPIAGGGTANCFLHAADVAHATERAEFRERIAS